MVSDMRAVRIHGRHDLRLERVDVPAPGPGEVLLRITGAGICGTDSTLYALGQSVIPAGTQARWPVVLGHEYAGEVVARGEGVSGLELGDLVASGAGMSCGACRRCDAGQTNLCTTYSTTGVHRDGGMAEYCAVPADICEPVAPHNVAGDAAALAQPMAVAEHAVDVAALAAGERALILGAGGIGSFATWAATCRDADVTVYERDEARLGITARLGATRTVLAEHGASAREQLADLGPFDVTYEMTGHQDPLDAAVALTRPGGRVVAVGIHGSPRPVDLDRVTLQQISVLGTMAHVRRHDLPRALDLLGRRNESWSDVAPLVHPLEAVVGENGLVFPTDEHGAAPIKTLVDPAATSSRTFV